MKKFDNNSEAGFSIAELLTVLLIVGLISTFAFMSLNAGKLYEADRQALQITDVLQEARQRALSQRSTMRVEFNATDRMVRLIDEKKSGDATDDVQIKAVPYMIDGVFVGTAPANMSGVPTELSPVPALVFTGSNHPSSSGDNVATLRFMRNGTVMNAGTNSVGANAVITGATIFVWSKYPDDHSANPTIGQIFRAVTVLGTSGSSRLWKCSVSGGACSEWVQ